MLLNEKSVASESDGATLEKNNIIAFSNSFIFVTSEGTNRFNFKKVKIKLFVVFPMRFQSQNQRNNSYTNNKDKNKHCAKTTFHFYTLFSLKLCILLITFFTIKIEIFCSRNIFMCYNKTSNSKEKNRTSFVYEILWIRAFSLQNYHATKSCNRNE